MDILNITTQLPIKNNEIVKVMFSWYDYALFGAMLFLSIIIGIYFGCFGKKQSSATEYLMGGKTMHVFPVAMSLVASKISGIFLLSVPADVYSYGATYWLSCVGNIFASLATLYIYIPVFYKLQLTSTYEYLKLRFDTRIRLFASFLFALSTFLYLPIVIYVPAMALSQATDLNIHFITPIVCGVCIFYTTIGGLKAVVWTDMLQFSITIIAMIAILYIGTSATGGLQNVLTKSYEGHRFDISFDWSPTTRDSFFAMIIGWSVNTLAHVAIAQDSLQKFLSVPTMKDITRAILLFIVGIVVIKTASVLTGLIIYAKYSDCDPISTNVINKPDQLLPYYVMDVAAKIPGLPGLFISGVFCAALSTLSATMNCLSGTIYEDFISRYMPETITQKSVSNILKTIVLAIGIVSTSMVFLVQHLGAILPLSIKFASVSTGPLLGMFTLGLLFPMANAKGAFYGGVTSLIFICWILVTSHFYRAKGYIRDIPKPVSTDHCNFDFTPINATVFDQPEEEVFFLYRFSHYYYTLAGALVCMSTGLIISYFTKNVDDPPVNRDYLSPVIYPLLDKKKDKENKNEYYSIDKALNLIANKDSKKENTRFDS